MASQHQHLETGPGNTTVSVCLKVCDTSGSISSFRRNSVCPREPSQRKRLIQGRYFPPGIPLYHEALIRQHCCCTRWDGGE
jgi:hypothetical protein